MSRIIHPCELIRKNAQHYPDRLAVVGVDGNGITYAELLRMVSLAGQVISEKSGGVRKPVIVLCERSIWSYIAMLAVVWAGDFYCPVDSKIPDKRLEKISDILGSPLIVRGDQTGVEEMLSDGERKGKRGTPWENLIDRDLLYVMFTSGSTGTPKGVGVRISAALEMAENFLETFRFPEPLIVGNQAPFDFDVSTKDIYISLYRGGTILVVPGKYFAMPGDLAEVLVRNGVNTLIWSVSALRVVENFHGLDHCVPDNIKLVMFSGETMHPRIMRYWQHNLPGCTFVNLYGPTEVTGNCTYYLVDREFEDNEKIPVGKPFKNLEVRLEDGSCNAVTEQGVEGEICIRGERVSAGYYNNPEQTEKVFKQAGDHNSFLDRVYHTGDMGKYDVNGNILFCGRRDHQIKYMGHRIELGEIEAAGVTFSEINICCALFDEEKNRIVFFYEAQENLQKQILERFKEVLPKYMIPRTFYRMDKIPQNNHGKCDRTKLQGMLSVIK